MNYKGLTLKKEDVSITKNMVEGYFAKFDNVDSHMEMFIKGAFANSITERGPESKGNRKIIHLAYHNLTRPIGVIKKLEEDEYGLYFASKMPNTTESNDFLEMYREGLINEHSVGFNYIASAIKQKDNYSILTDVELFEGSAVVFGANSETNNLSKIKSMEDAEYKLDECNKRMGDLILTLKDNTHIKTYNGYVDIEVQKIKEEYNRIIDLMKKGFDKEDIVLPLSIKKWYY